MADENERLICQLQQLPENKRCADCGTRSQVEWASYNIGVFLCTRCAAVHRSIGVQISKVKHLKLDKWEDSQIERMQAMGNKVAREQYEKRIPLCYLRPNEFSNPWVSFIHLFITWPANFITRNRPHRLLIARILGRVSDSCNPRLNKSLPSSLRRILQEQWIRAKYERLEFSVNERPIYTSGYMDGFLMKRGKEDSRYQPRKFILKEADDTLRYFIKENREPKAILRISSLNVIFAPPKIEHPYSLQLTYLREGSTRHIYVYHDQPEVIVNWFMAIRCAKLHRLQIAFPLANESEILDELTWDFGKEGWLQKTGPKLSDGYKRRWFTLENRKLMYHDDPMDPYPKGEIFLGHYADGWVWKWCLRRGINKWTWFESSTGTQ